MNIINFYKSSKCRIIVVIVGFAGSIILPYILLLFLPAVVIYYLIKR
ncbi:hypothetical protein [Clostridium sp. BJN0013]